MLPRQKVNDPFRASGPTRRTFLAGLAAVGAGVAQTPPAAPHRIDVHNHVAPPNYVAELTRMGQVQAGLQGWTPAKAVEDMDRAGVATSITSISPPGIWFGDDATARRIARICNDYEARLAADHPGRFGMFVNLPLPDVDGSLREIEYGFDALKADGVCFYTSYGDKWLGDPAFNPVYEELNRRKALIYTHPISANCCRNILPGIGDGAIEWGTDTTRAITRMIFGGAAARYPDIRAIFSHAGGTMPFLVERFINLAKGRQYSAQLPQGFLASAKKFYYDTAQTSNPAAMSALTKVVPASQIVFGTDFPYRTAAEHVKGLAECGVFSAKELAAIDRENALTLLPRFRTLRAAYSGAPPTPDANPILR
ncbi:MAG TPA: amidohydrolase family protein [Bryobacteraceae bacterium]|nr:amidohydrolase family protein [Bryobacteraceae bacterium]